MFLLLATHMLKDAKGQELTVLEVNKHGLLRLRLVKQGPDFSADLPVAVSSV